MNEGRGKMIIKSRDMIFKRHCQMLNLTGNEKLVLVKIKANAYRIVILCRTLYLKFIHMI